MTSRWRADDAWTVLARRQDQVIALSQLQDWGWTKDDVRRPVASGHWLRLEPGVFATSPAPLGARALVWRAVLATGGVACGRTALWLAGVKDLPGPPGVAVRRPGGRAPDPVEVAVAWDRRVRPHPSRIVHRHRGLRELVHGGQSPPRVRAAAAALEVCASLDPEGVATLVLGVVQQRACTVQQLRSELERLTTLRHRDLVTAMLVEAEEGVTTRLELAYARDVERAHGLPRATRQHDLGVAGAPMVVDVWYPEFRVVVELDGQVAHPRHLAFRDHDRDNRVVVVGGVPLRFGWRDVAGRACAVAVQVGAVLQGQGWTGTPIRCGPSCAVV